MSSAKDLPGRFLPQGRVAAMVLLFLLFAVCLMVDPATAGNKFQTIGSGVSGSSELKREHMQIILYVISGMFMLGAVATVLMPRNNAQMLNFSLWKESAIVLTLLSIATFGLSLLL
jgi:hypothetical protein